MLYFLIFFVHVALNGVTLLMIVLRVKTKAGHIQELQVEELISIDGKNFQLTDNLSDRVTLLEQTVSEIVNWINQSQHPPTEGES